MKKMEFISKIFLLYLSLIKPQPTSIIRIGLDIYLDDSLKFFFSEKILESAGLLSKMGNMSNEIEKGTSDSLELFDIFINSKKESISDVFKKKSEAIVKNLDSNLSKKLIKKYFQVTFTFFNIFLKRFGVEIDYKILDVIDYEGGEIRECKTSSVIPKFLKNIEEENIKSIEEKREINKDLSPVRLEELQLGNRLYLIGCPKRYLEFKKESMVLNSNLCSTMGALAIGTSESSTSILKNLTIDFWIFSIKVIAGIEDEILSFSFFKPENLKENFERAIMKTRNCVLRPKAFK